MNRILLIALVTACLLLAPTATAEDPGQGNGNGPPGHSNAGGNGGGQNGTGQEGDDGEGSSSDDTAESSASTTTRQTCRLIGWDGGDIEPRLNPILGVIVLDPDGCGYGIVDQLPPR